MSSLLPIAAFIFFQLLLGKICRENFLFASVLWGFFVFLITESLSLWHQLSYAGLMTVWLFALAAMAAWLVKFRPKFSMPVPAFERGVVVLVLLAMGVLLTTAVIAWNAAPNNWDSMTYHLGRVAHWAQNKTIAFYPTSILRQLDNPPGAEYAMAQLYILGHGDRGVNFIQWFSSLGCMIGCSLIVARLKGTAVAQALAALIVATIPTGILQSTSTQNDYVTAFWLVCFVYFGLSMLEKLEWNYVFAAGAGLGLAWLTKGTGYIYALSFLGWFFFAGFKKYGRRFILSAVLILVLAAAINGTFYCRNTALTGGLMPPSESSRIIPKNFDLRAIASNLVLNAGLELASPWISFNNSVEQAAYQLHQWLGIAEGDLRACMENGVLLHIQSDPFCFHEDNSGNGAHFILVLVLVVVFGFINRKMDAAIRHYLFALLGGIVFYLIMVRWSPYNARYHLPGVVLFAPFLALVAVYLGKSRGALVLAVLLMGAALPWLLYNKSRPLLGAGSVLTAPRLQQYFTNNPNNFFYIYLMRDIVQSNCKNVGISSGEDVWEYPFWVMARQVGQDFRFEHVRVSNFSQKLDYPLGEFKPCLIISFLDNEPNVLQWAGQNFLKVDQQGSGSIYLRKN